jgi:hypothetical protein
MMFDEFYCKKDSGILYPFSVTNKLLSFTDAGTGTVPAPEPVSD